MSRTRVCTRTIRGTHLIARRWTAGSARTTCKCDRRMQDAGSVAETPLHCPRVALNFLCAVICFPTLQFSKKCWLMGFAQAPYTPVSPPTRQSHLSFDPSFQRRSMARSTRHPSPDRPPLQGPSVSPVTVSFPLSRLTTSLSKTPPTTQLGNFLRCHTSNLRR